MTGSRNEALGSCCVVLHTHLPWVAHAGTWPVGEEWLHQAWSASYLPVFTMLERLAAEGRRDLVTVGVTPVLWAMLDDPYCLREFHTWLGGWQARASELATRHRNDAAMREVAAYEHRLASGALSTYETRWRHGASPVIRALADAGAVELLGGPATHAFQPLLDERLVDLGLAVGLEDARRRVGAQPGGLWAPECGYRPGLETHYARAAITHFVVDGPTLLAANPAPHAAGRAWRVGDGEVVAFARDLDVTYRVWSPRAGYPGGHWYRDFHTFDHPTGIRPARVTSSRTPPEAKRPYEPAAAAASVARDAADFVAVVRDRLSDVVASTGAPGVVVVAYDTELFGHWWHEGPAWLEQVLRLLPGAGVELRTLRGAIDAGAVGGRVTLPAGSWGSGKDWRVWSGEPVREMVEQSRDLEERLLAVTRKVWSDETEGSTRRARSAAADQMVREALLALASDWAFSVSKDTAAHYAWRRFTQHRERFGTLADSLAAAHWHRADSQAARFRSVDGPFGHLDARALLTP